jgi:membrane associated rhomboid family serine protease
MRSKLPMASTREERRAGVALLAAIVALMWLVEVINTLDSNHLDGDGIHARNFDRIWGILTSPFIHASFQHLLDNTIPFLFMGLFIALRGAARLALVTAIVIVLGGLGTWLISPARFSTIGASGLVFGYATYLFARGFFDRSVFEFLIGVIVGLVWGGALISSLVPHSGISWQAHLCGGIAGVLAAWALAGRDARRRLPGGSTGPAGAASSRPVPVAARR